jgi:hypothetical protein
MGYFLPIPWTTAEPNQIPLVMSEDFKDGFALDGVHCVDSLTCAFNPFTLGSPRPTALSRHKSGKLLSG